MSKLILDEALRAKLDLQNGPTELCDADGKAVAYVLSADEYTRLLYDLDRLESATPEVSVRGVGRSAPAYPLWSINCRRSSSAVSRVYNRRVRNCGSV